MVVCSSAADIAIYLSWVLFYQTFYLYSAVVLLLDVSGCTIKPMATPRVITVSSGGDDIGSSTLDMGLFAEKLKSKRQIFHARVRLQYWLGYRYLAIFRH